VPAAKQGKLKLALQPYLQLLQLDHPVDDFILAVKQREAGCCAATRATRRRPCAG